MSVLKLTNAVAFVSCDLHDAEGLMLADDEAVPMRKLGGVLHVELEMEIDDVHVELPNMTAENDS